MKKYLDVLKKCTLFHNVTDEQLSKMLTCLGARVVPFDKRYTIFAEGVPAKYIGIVLSGSAQMIQVDYDGNRSIISELHAPEMVAEAFACAEVKSLPVSVIANEPSEIMLVDCSHILHTCQNNCAFHQQMIFNLMKDIASKTIQFHQRIEITSKRSTRKKLLAYLDLQSRIAGSDSFDIPFDRQELADYLEVDRSGLSAEISKMIKDGLIKNEKKHFVLL